MSLFENGPPPPPPLVPWFGAGTATQNRAVLRGLHPLGLPLGPAASTCGTCAHRFLYSRSRSYWKCDLRATRCAATDLRLKWRGCEMFEEGPSKRGSVYAPD